VYVRYLFHLEQLDHNPVRFVSSVVCVCVGEECER